MRPGRSPKSDPGLFLAAQFGRKSVRAADHEYSIWNRLIPQAAEALGQRLTADIFAAFVERDKHGVFRDCGRDRRGLLRDARSCVAGAAFRNFVNLEAAKAELAADVLEALAVALGELALRSGFQPADGYDDESHPFFRRSRTCLPDNKCRSNTARATGARIQARGSRR